MTATRRRRYVAGAILGLGLLAVAGRPALAQQRLVCATLHNDLANFDRRAREANGYYVPRVLVDRRRLAAYEAQYDAECGGQPATPACLALHDHVVALNGRISDIIVSPIGGSDPVRLNILKAMRRNGCPPPNDPVVELQISRGVRR